MNLKKRCAFLSVSFIICCLSGISQDSTLITPRLTASYVKFSDGTKRISASLSTRVEGQRITIDNENLQVSAWDESDPVFLGDIFTDNHGNAILDISPGKSLPKNRDGNYVFGIRYEGSTKYSNVTSVLEITDVSLDLSFAVIDSVKTVMAQVYRQDESGRKTNISGVPVEFFIKRLFSLYRFGSEETDSSGTCSMEFPRKMPGDTAGNLIVIVKIPDDENYGTVEKSRKIDWGQRLVIEPKSTRGLGDTDAPLWMVYTLIVLLAGVWVHVFYVISLVIRINLIGRKVVRQHR